MTSRSFNAATKSTPDGLLSDTEVWRHISDLARKVKATAGITSTLFSALRGGVVASVMGPGSSETRLPESESATIRHAAMYDSDIGINVLHSFVMNETYHGNAREAIIRFTESQVAQAKANMVHALNAQLNGHGHAQLPDILDDIIARQVEITNILGTLQTHQVASASISGVTARSKLTSKRLDLEKEFDSAADHNSDQLKTVLDCSNQIRQIEIERESIESGGIATIRDRKDDLKELSDLQQIAERRKAKAERQMLEYYVPDPGNMSTSKSKDSSESFLKLIPQGLEKGKGSELADKAKI